MFVLAGLGILISGRTGVKAGCQCHRSYDGGSDAERRTTTTVMRKAADPRTIGSHAS
jgi:hypothetical protein